MISWLLASTKNETSGLNIFPSLPILYTLLNPLLLSMKREEIMQAIIEKYREMSTETIKFHQAVADVLGLYITDHKCLDLLS
jgi:hypothetical protein